MIPVRLCEGAIDGAVLHDTLLPTIPRVGETFSIRFARHVAESRYAVVAVDYLLDPGEGPQVREELTGVRVAVHAI